ncbi:MULTISPECIES: DNA primase [unclassified Corynebacterium]|uniref:DNA primase n=1 Tax=Corynebacterium TaxID=1716 RepID=UPI00255111CA|nr:MULTISPECIES: DNA primase [unclassified Corynebacterium]MDK8452531.1 DNA primase [Corynebacterium sp. MSK084]MDK8468150.1 DNA primase [Corynebacterium sp. MSK130]MDK8514260.1 DNA primase [Corynebacterium sp. MSK123]MDK8547695.1 DNA primase [Corynebacterium sp. MSK222]MDK8647334.1 DNA primase [Corynebacterium sp. MSK082]
MSFFEDIASALDAEGIESRVNEDVMFVPITSDLEIQFVEIDPLLPAANVYIAAADVDEDDEEFEAVLVSVAFSVEDAVEAVSRHIATDQVVTVLRDLLEGTDERIAELEFDQDELNPHLVVAEVGNDSELRVLVETIDGVPSAIVRFLAFDFDEEDMEELEDEAVTELWQVDEDGEDLDENERLALFGNTDSDDIPIVEVPAEALELGTYTDFDRLFDVLGLVSEQALDWEAQLVNFDEDDFEEPDVYDIFCEDADDDDDEDLEFFDTFTEEDDADADDEGDNN